jgi:serine/threonine protein phosphatase PrpC
MEMQNYAQPLILDKSKVSSKGYGLIHGYSANSHSGPLLNYNEDRICIVTNLTKNNAKHKQVSFFGVYDGHNGTGRADYMRDNYHLMLIQDDAFPTNMETALRRTLIRLNSGFAEDPRFSGDSSAVSFAIIVVLSTWGVT